jgi:hypothetical protein
MHRNIDHDAVPAGRTVAQFTFPDVRASSRHWWLVISPDDADVCDADPGYPVAVTVTASLRRLTEVWRGDLSWAQALGSGAVTIHGPEITRRALPQWFTLPAFALVTRPVPERTRK